MHRLPIWFKQELPDNTTSERMRLLSKLRINTVCSQAKCPNLSSCFKNLRFTFMLLGNTCTRNCRFCNVNQTYNSPLDIDLDEPWRIKNVVERLGLNYVVITSVTRDDLEDGGAKIFAKTLELIHRLNKNITIEILIPDFRANLTNLECVLNAHPSVVGHNIETVRRLYKDLRPQANYQLSLDILKKVKELDPGLITKSSLMLGLGETEEEVMQTLQDLRNSFCDILVLGQYLAPSQNHYPVKEFINLEQFPAYRDMGLSLGFKSVLSGPLVRSSYKAEEVYRCMM